MKFFLALAAIAGVANAFNITGPNNQWSRIGGSLTIQCRSQEPILNCAFETGYGKDLYLGHGLKAEEGRIEYFLDDNNHVCGLKVNPVEAKDAGIWTCNVNVANEDSEVITASGKGTVTLAQKPESITLDKPFDEGTANVTDEWNSKPIRCIVRNATPKPAFKWFVDDEELSGYEVENDNKEMSYFQTLKYSPLAEHANKTLRCVVDHVGLDQTDSKEAGVVLRFTEVSDDYLKEILEEKENKMVQHPDISLTIPAVSFVALVVLIIVTMVLFKLRLRCKNEHTDTDVESGTQETPEQTDSKSNKSVEISNGTDKSEIKAVDNKSDDGEEKRDEEKPEEETKDSDKKTKIGFTQRMATFFGFQKKENADETGIKSEKANDEFDTIDLENIDQEKLDKEEDKEEDNPEEKKPKGFGNVLIKLFKSKGKQDKADVVVIVEDKSTEETSSGDESKVQMDEAEKENEDADKGEENAVINTDV